jgi:hypothetical protein
MKRRKATTGLSSKPTPNGRGPSGSFKALRLWPFSGHWIKQSDYMSSQDSEPDAPQTANNSPIGPADDGFKTPTDTNPHRQIEIQRVAAQAYNHGHEVGLGEGVFIGGVVGFIGAVLLTGAFYFAVLRRPGSASGTDSSDD